MKPSTILAGGVSLLSSMTPSITAAEEQSSIDLSQFTPYGFQSGTFNTNNDNNPLVQQQSELLNDDSYAASMYYDAQHNLLFFTGSTYGTYFDSATNLSSEIKGAMGMSDKEGGRDVGTPHLETSDCFLGILKMPMSKSPMVMVGNGDGNSAPWLNHVDEDEAKKEKDKATAAAGPELIYARRFGTKHNSEVCSSILMLPKVNDALLQTTAQLKLALLGHVNPTPLSSADENAFGAVGGGERRGKRQLRQLESISEKLGSRQLESDVNRGGFLHSLSENSPVEQWGRAYGFMVDFDLSLTLDETFTTTLPNDTTFHNAYGALLGGHVLESSPLVYPTAMAQNKRDPNIVYVVSMHSDDDAPLMNPEYKPGEIVREVDFTLRERADMTFGGAGTSGSKIVGGVPKYGSNFFVKVQQLTVTPYQQLMDVDPTPDEQVKQTMESGWGFGFKLNDADDVRPSAIVFVKGRTPNDDILLLGGTTRKDGSDGQTEELDGFITKLIPPAPTPIADMTTGDSPENAIIEDESIHPTKRIDSTTGRDETVTAICLPPPDPVDGIISHAYVVGSITADRGHGPSQPHGHDPNLAYILKLRLDDLSTVWKEQIPSIFPRPGMGGDVLGEGCAVSPDGKMVYLSGTIDGGSALNPGLTQNINGERIQPVGGTSDVFVVAFDVDFGNVQWAKQLGTVFEDKLARGGGVACDNEGNVIIMGSSRGGLQRYRSPEDAAKSMASDVFVMSLSRTNGDYINAPYTGDDKKPVSGSGGTVTSSAAAPATESTPESNDGGQGEMSAGVGAIVGIFFFVIGLSGALVIALRHRRHKVRTQFSHNAQDGGVLRTWQQNNGDDFRYDNRPLGGRRTSSVYQERSPSTAIPGGGLMRNIRGAMSDWEMPGWGGGGGDDSGSVHSTGSSLSKRSYTSKQQEDNSDFLASLRQEANATMKEMVKDSEDQTTDPRLDDGASIKSLLTHYREVKKDTLFDDVHGKGDGGGKKGGEGHDQGEKASWKSKQPPPPPPRRKNNGQAAAASNSLSSTADGLSEFTII